MSRSSEPQPAGWCTRAVVLVLSVTTAWVPWALVWGDDFRAAAQAGQGVGTQARTDFAVPTTNGSTLRLFPGTAAGDVSYNSLFPGAQSANPSAFSALFGNHAGTLIQGQHAQATLLNDPAATGGAYRTLRATVDRSRPDMRLDPLWSQTDEVITNFAEISRTFADCALSTTFTTGERQAHVPEYRTCDRLEDHAGACSVFHDYTMIALVTAWGGATVQSCGSGCTQISYRQADTPHEDMGTHYPAYRAPQTFGYTVSDSSRITSASVAVAPRAPSALDFQIDQYTERYSVAFDGYAYADTSTASFDAVNRPAITMEWTANLKDGASFTVGNDYAFRTTGPRQWWRAASAYTVTVTLRHTPLVQERGWSNTPSCVNLANALAANGGFCQGSITCRGAPPLDANGCYTSGGTNVCPGDLQPSPIPGQSPFCTQVEVVADCSGFNRGQMACWTDPQGNQQCPFNEGNNPTDCTALEQNPQCGFIKSACVEGAQDANGHCYLHEETWDCGALARIPVLDRQSTMNCAGPVRCMGTDCASFPSEQSADFAQAAATLQAAQMAASDMQCEPGGDCVVFAGEAAECKRAVGGIVNCCKTPGTTNLSDYLDLVIGMSKIDHALLAMDHQNVVRGAWETLRGPVASTWSAVQETFTSAANTLMGNVAPSATDAAAKVATEGVSQLIMQQTAEWAAQLFGDAAVNLLFSTTAGGSAVVNGAVQGTLQLGGGAALLGTVLAVVMWAYLIYQIVMILIKLLWTCEQDEFALGAKRELKSCVRVGGYCKSDVLGWCVEKRDAYCCFTTPLARILQEQLRPQLGLGWGEPKQPDCTGLKVADFGRVDWNQVNLDEWLGILVQTGHFPTLEKLNIEDLTGMGSALAVDGQRPTAAVRASARTDGLAGDQVRHDAAGEAWGATLPALPGAAAP